MSDTPEELEIDLERITPDRWHMKCADALSRDEEGLSKLRAHVRRFKRKGGDGGKPGDFDELFNELV